MRTLLSDAFPARRQHLADRSQLAAAGLGSAALARAVAADTVVRVRRGVYSPTALPARSQHLVSGGDPDPAYLAHVRAALMSLGGTAMAAGRTAAVLWGFDMLVEPRSVELAVPESRNGAPPRGVTLRRRRGAAPVEHGFLGTDPIRVLPAALTVADCAMVRPMREAVVIADSALRGGRVTLEDLEQTALGYAHHPSGWRLRRVLDLVDPASGSVLESALRLVLLQRGLRPESQVVLHDAQGGFIGRVDFLFREARLVLECDGRRWHDPQDARERDRIRDNELERAAWRLLRVGWNEVVHQPDRVISLVQDCLAPWPQAA